jgi:hypothetical protein
MLQEDNSNDLALDAEQPQDSRDTSPVAGEGRRLGGSSLNGSSSALQVGHGREGAGPVGLAHGGSQQTHGLSVGTDSPRNLSQGLAANSSGERDPPPAYSDNDSAIGDIDAAAMMSQNAWPREAWSFDNLTTQRAPANSETGIYGDNRSLGSNDSTRAEGGDERSPFFDVEDDAGSIHHEVDQPIHSEDMEPEPIMHIEDFNGHRSIRESAPPPDHFAGLSAGRGMSMPVGGHDSTMDIDDDNDDPPVMELHPDGFHPAT